MNEARLASVEWSPAVAPSRLRRLGAVWYRHMRVYTKNSMSNSLPPFIEPLIFLAGIGLGLGTYVSSMEGLPYVQYLASGLLMTTAMFTAAFEMSFGSYIRLQFDKIYDGMLGAPVSAADLMLGEFLWCGSKGAFFSASVVVTTTILGVLHFGWIWLSPIAGFLTGVMFAALALLVTTLVDNINNFNFFFSGLISPMFFFSGVVFPLAKLPPWLRVVAEFLPLTHPVRLTRGLATRLSWVHLWDLIYIVAFIVAVGWIGIARMRKRLID